jgi:hypothetical protein
MSTLRTSALEEIEELLESAKRLRADLRVKETAYRRTARLLEKGEQIDAVLEASGARSGRQELTDSMDDFERHRHRTRSALTAVALDEGMTIGQIARQWGFSRQLASRYAREVRGKA